ncbi:WYL domain-containing protein [Desulfotignum phosphitoxidans]
MRKPADLSPTLQTGYSAIPGRFTGILLSSQRRVAPYNIWFAGDTFYMTGLCHMRHEIRIRTA